MKLKKLTTKELQENLLDDLCIYVATNNIEIYHSILGENVFTAFIDDITYSADKSHLNAFLLGYRAAKCSPAKFKSIEPRNEIEIEGRKIGIISV